MAFQKKPNSGYFGKNKDKKGPNSPDYSGSLLLGEDTMAQLMAEKMAGRPLTLFLAGWKKTSAGGESYLSLACNPPKTGQQQGASQSQGRSRPPSTNPSNHPPKDDEGEDIPF